MPGFYPEIPDHKFAYDVDGTVMHSLDSTALTIESTFPQSVRTQFLTNINTGLFNKRWHWACFVFPEQRDIVGVFFGHANNIHADRAVQTSTDTTNGVDGNWTTQASLTGTIDSSAANRRTGIHIVNFTGVYSIRIQRTGISGNSSHDFSGFDFYGNLTQIESATKLRIWHPTDDEEVLGSYFDFGDIPRTADQTKQFRIKNNSSSLTASSISLSLDGLPNTSPSLIGQFQLSTDGETFVDSLNIGNLAPGALSNVMYARLQVAPDAALGLQQARMSAIADSWS